MRGILIAAAAAVVLAGAPARAYWLDFERANCAAYPTPQCEADIEALRRDAYQAFSPDPPARRAWLQTRRFLGPGWAKAGVPWAGHVRVGGREYLVAMVGSQGVARYVVLDDRDRVVADVRGYGLAQGPGGLVVALRKGYRRLLPAFTVAEE